MTRFEVEFVVFRAELTPPDRSGIGVVDVECGPGGTGESERVVRSGTRHVVRFRGGEVLDAIFHEFLQGGTGRVVRANEHVDEADRFGLGGVEGKHVAEDGGGVHRTAACEVGPPGRERLETRFLCRRTHEWNSLPWRPIARYDGFKTTLAAHSTTSHAAAKATPPAAALPLIQAMVAIPRSARGVTPLNRGEHSWWKSPIRNSTTSSMALMLAQVSSEADKAAVIVLRAIPLEK